MWILGIQKQADAAVCLVHNGNLVYNYQEERLSRKKRDTYPFKTISEIKKFTDKIDQIVFSGYDFITQEN
jgi:predicted NodU family carbamoyl transferase